VPLRRAIPATRSPRRRLDDARSRNPSAARVDAQIKIMEEGGRTLTALIPHTVNGQPNPHFERLYALALNRGKLREICMDGDRASSAVVGMTVIYQ
jgi:hypothetical protein